MSRALERLVAPALFVTVMLGWPSVGEGYVVPECPPFFGSAPMVKAYAMAAGSALFATPALDQGHGRFELGLTMGTSDAPKNGRRPTFSPGLTGRSGGQWDDWGFDISWLAIASSVGTCLTDFSQFAAAASRRLVSSGRYELWLLVGPQLSFVDVLPYGTGAKVGLSYRWRPADVVALTSRLSYLPTFFEGGYDNHPIRASLEFAIPTNNPWHLTMSVHGGTNRNGRIPRAGVVTGDPVDWYTRGHFGFSLGVRTSQTFESPSETQEVAAKRGE